MDELLLRSLAGNSTYLQQRMETLRTGRSEQLLNARLKQLTQEKSEHKAASNRLQTLLNLQQEGLDLQQEIDELNLDIQVQAILPSAQTDISYWEEKMESWVARLNQYMIRLTADLFQDYNTCKLVIVGQNLLPIVEWYAQLLDHLQFTYQIYAWKAASTPPGKKSEQQTTSPQFERIEVPWSLDSKPGEPEALLAGVEFDVTGPCSYLLLSPESGVQQWDLADETSWSYEVQVAKEVSIPPLALRKEYFSRLTPTRILGPGFWEDTDWAVQRKEPPSGAVTHVADGLRNELYERLASLLE